MEKEKYNLTYFIKLPMKFSPMYSSLVAISKVVDGIIPSLMVLATAKFIDTSILVVSSKGNFLEIIPTMIILLMLISYTWISTKLIKFAEIKMEIGIRHKLRSDIIDKRANLSYKYIENNHS